MKMAIKAIKSKIVSFFIRIKKKRIDWKQNILYKTAKRRVFIDCGANTGKVLEEFILKKTGFEFYAFEPQPELADTGKRIKAEYPGLSLTFYNQAVWTENTTMNFYLATRWGPNYKGGSTLLQGNTLNKNCIDYKHAEKVRTIDFSKWLLLSFCKRDYIIIKMDIEGSEYEVLEKMIRDGSITFVNELIIEFHYHKYDHISEERHQKLEKELNKHAKLTQWV